MPPVITPERSTDVAGNLRKTNGINYNFTVGTLIEAVNQKDAAAGSPFSVPLCKKWVTNSLLRYYDKNKSVAQDRSGLPSTGLSQARRFFSKYHRPFSLSSWTQDVQYRQYPDEDLTELHLHRKIVYS
jgi:hypothetical protein